MAQAWHRHGDRDSVFKWWVRSLSVTGTGGTGNTGFLPNSLRRFSTCCTVCSSPPLSYVSLRTRKGCDSCDTCVHAGSEASDPVPWHRLACASRGLRCPHTHTGCQRESAPQLRCRGEDINANAPGVGPVLLTANGNPTLKTFRGHGPQRTMPQPRTC